MVATLDTEFLRELSYVAEDEGMMKKLTRYVHRLLAEKKDDTLYTDEEFRRKLEHSSAQLALGQTIRQAKDETAEQFINRMLCMK